MHRLSVFGRIDFRDPVGREVNAVIAQPKRLALLAYLAANAGTAACRRDRLLALFWPELDEPRARKALNRAVHFLRHEIGGETIPSRNGDEIAVDPTHLWCDIAAFQSAVNSGDWTHALTLYRGDLLPSFYVDDAPAFDEWMEQERTRLRLAAASAARALATEREHEGKATIAISLARRAAALSELDERMVRQLLALLDRLGDRAGALEVYDRFARRLRDEFDAEPAVETNRLIAEIRARADASPNHKRDVATLGVRPTPTEHFTPNSERALFEALRARGYEIERELGRGSTATVYLARDAKHDRSVALKLLSPEIGELRHRERFFTEIRVTARLQHPNILPVFDSGDVKGVMFYVMPFVDGESLRSRLVKDGALNVPEAVSLLRDVAKALAYAHERGVVHRDIKPDNVLLTAGTAVVADFGIAKAIAAAQRDSGGDGATLTHQSMSLGTPAYMSPEQAAADPKTDHRADIYAWGCTAYEMLAGQTPFAAASPRGLLAAHISDAPPPLSELRHDAPIELSRLVMQCLEKDPDARPSSAAQLVQTLDAISSGKRSPIQATPRNSTSMRAKAIAMIGVVAVAVAVAVAIAALVLSRRSVSPNTPITRRQFTNTGWASWPALSPDTRTIAFVEEEPCQELRSSCADSLMVQDVAGRQPALLAVGTGIIHPKWNPDGGSILFLSSGVANAPDTMPGYYGAYLVSLVDRTPRRVGPGGAAAFNARGDTIVLANRVATSDTIRLRFLRSADLEVVDSASVLISGAPLPWQSELDWSPDGKWLALLVYVGHGDRSVFLVSRRRGVVTDSITKVRGRQMVRWVPTGDAVLLLLQNQAGSSDDKLLRWGVDGRTGHFIASDTVTKLEIPTGGATFDVSRDGKTLVSVVGSKTATEYTAMELVGRRVTSHSLPSVTGESGWPALSPDGRTIALPRGDAQGSNLYLIPFEGGPERQLTSGRHHFDDPVWLRDGRLVFKAGLPTTQLFVIDPRHPQPRPFGPTQFTTGNLLYLQWLDDPAYVVDQSNPHRVLVVDSSGSVLDSVSVPQTLGMLVAATPDARQLWFSVQRNFERRRVYSLDPLTKVVTLAFEVDPNSQAVGWADDTFVFATWPKRITSSPTLWRVNPGGTFTKIALLPAECDFNTGSISMSRNGRRFVCRRTNPNRDIWLWRGVGLR
jgi:eukaryotic-like serine/threonine-protein kinase